MGAQPPRGRAVEALTHRRVVTEDDVHEAMETLRGTVDPISRARGRVVVAEAMLKHIKGLEMTFSNERSVSGQERDAYASDRYKQAIQEWREAATEFERLKAERENAVMVIEVYRTSQASERAAARL